MSQHIESNRITIPYELQLVLLEWIMNCSEIVDFPRKLNRKGKDLELLKKIQSLSKLLPLRSQESISFDRVSIEGAFTQLIKSNQCSDHKKIGFIFLHLLGLDEVLSHVQQVELILKHGLHNILSPRDLRVKIKDFINKEDIRNNITDAEWLQVMVPPLEWVPYDWHQLAEMIDILESREEHGVEIIKAPAGIPTDIAEELIGTVIPFSLNLTPLVFQTPELLRNGLDTPEGKWWFVSLKSAVESIQQQKSNSAEKFMQWKKGWNNPLNILALNGNSCEKVKLEAV